MNRLYNTPSPLHSPVGTPTNWYSPTHTPSNTPVGSVTHGHLHRRSTESLHSAVSERLTSHADVNRNISKQENQDVEGELSNAANSLQHTDESEVKETSSDQTTAKTGCLQFSAHEFLTMGVLCFTGICSSMFASLLAPFFPTEAVAKGVSQTWIGLIFGSFQLVSFIMCPVWGHYISKIGAKFMYVSGIMVCGSCAILFGILEWCPPGRIYILMCFCTRTLESIAGAAVGTANMAIATYTFPGHVSTVIGILNACSCIGLMVGPPVGGVLYELDGFYLPFLVTGSTFVLAGLLCMCFLPAPKESLHEKENADAKKIPKWKLLQIPAIFFAGYLTLIGQFAIGYMDVVFTIHLDTKYHLSPTIIGVIFLIAPLVVVMLAPACGALVDRFPVMARPIMVVGALVSGLGFAGLGPSKFYSFLYLPDKLWVVLVSLAIAGIGWGAIVVTYQEFNNAARRRGYPHTIETQGLVAGVYNAFSNLGAFLGPVVGGLMSDKMGFVMSSTIVAGLITWAGVQMFVFTVVEKLCCNVPPFPPSTGSDVSATADDRQHLINTETSPNAEQSSNPNQNGIYSNYQPTENRFFNTPQGSVQRSEQPLPNAIPPVAQDSRQTGHENTQFDTFYDVH